MGNSSHFTDRMLPVGWFLIVCVIANTIGSRGTILSGAVMCLIVSIVLFQRILASAWLVRGRLMALLLIACLATLHAATELNREFSVWQLARSHAWPFVGLLFLRAGVRWGQELDEIARQRLISALGLFSILSATACAIELVSGLEVSPAYIRTEVDADGQFRLYVAGLEIAMTFIPVFLLARRYLAAAACYFMMAATAGKTMLAIGACALLYALVFDKKSARTFFIMIVGVIVVLAYGVSISSRIQGALDETDASRLFQIMDGINVFLTDWVTMLFGIGFGTEYGYGYLVQAGSASASELAALLENSRFDIENGYIYWLARGGIVGMLLLLSILSGIKGRYRWYFVAALGILWAGGSNTGASGALTFGLFGVAAGLSMRDSETARP